MTDTPRPTAESPFDRAKRIEAEAAALSDSASRKPLAHEFCPTCTCDSAATI